MNQIRYTKAVGQKFHPDGSLRYFPGNTIVSMCLEEPFFSELVWAQDQFRQLPFAHKFSFLPHSSFHMTVIELVCDQVRKETHWSSLLPLDMPLPEVDAAFRDMLRPVEFPERIVMDPDPAGVVMGQAIVIRLRPADEQCAATLQAFRDAVANATGVRFPNHETYKFHISLAYNLIELSDDEKQTFAETKEKVDARLAEGLRSLTLGQPEYVLFDDMGEFKPDLVRREPEA